MRWCDKNRYCNNEQTGWRDSVYVLFLSAGNIAILRDDWYTLAPGNPELAFSQQEVQVMAQAHDHEHPHTHAEYEDRFKKMEERIKSLEETLHRLSHTLQEHTQHSHPKVA